MLRCESITAFCGPVVPLEKNIMTGSSPVTPRSAVAGRDGSRSAWLAVSHADICNSFHAMVLTPTDDTVVSSSSTITVYKTEHFFQFTNNKADMRIGHFEKLYTIVKRIVNIVQYFNANC